MSASNWSVCPRCLDRAQLAYKAAVASVMSAYGQIPLAEFDRRRAELKQPVEEDFMTFREDYEFYGAHTGTLHASYGGSCTVCGLDANLKVEKTFYVPSVPL